MCTTYSVFERKILRRIYGPVCEGTTWRSRYNEELYRLYDETDLVTSIVPSVHRTDRVHLHLGAQTHTC
jgi:hypothetical protein